MNNKLFLTEIEKIFELSYSQYIKHIERETTFVENVNHPVKEYIKNISDFLQFFYEKGGSTDKDRKIYCIDIIHTCMNLLSYIETKTIDSKIGKNILDNAFSILKKKSIDYSPKEDSLKNFRYIEIMSNNEIKKEMGIFVRVCDKLSRIENITNTNVTNVQDERIQDTLLDIINYLAIYFICIEN